MGRFIVIIGGLLAAALVWTSLSGANSGLVGQVSAALQIPPREPECALLLTDGSTITVPVAEAEQLTTAAAQGTAAHPAVAMNTAAAVSCRIPNPRGLPVEGLTESGLTPRAATVSNEVEAVFGPIPDGGYAPGGISSGHGARSAHYEGRAVDLFFRPLGDPAQRERGWIVTNWLNAHAQRLQVAVLIFDDQIWSTRRSAQGWRPYTNPDGMSDPISRHLDHIHVDVIRGS